MRLTEQRSGNGRWTGHDGHNSTATTSGGGEAAQSAANAPAVVYCRTNAEAADLLRPLLGPEDIVLVKGARVAQTEEVVAALRAHEEAG